MGILRKWRVAMSPDGKPYYYHTATRETVWEQPKEYNQELVCALVGLVFLGGGATAFVAISACPLSL